MFLWNMKSVESIDNILINFKQSYPSSVHNYKNLDKIYLITKVLDKMDLVKKVPD